jgi:8-oxo-dGTP pyrophosphatase MutT (NUDIX family)
METDLQYKLTESDVFNYRVSCLLNVDGFILLHKLTDDDFYTLPGGRCKFLEQSGHTIKRELQEEINEEVIVGPLLWLIENFFDFQQNHYHELNLVYRGKTETMRQGNNFTKNISGKIYSYEWFDEQGMENILFKPNILKNLLFHPPENTCHLIQRN